MAVASRRARRRDKLSIAWHFVVAEHGERATVDEAAASPT